MMTLARAVKRLQKKLDLSDVSPPDDPVPRAADAPSPNLEATAGFRLAFLAALHANVDVFP